MKNRIFLFCNRDFGRLFFEAFRRFAAGHPDYECVVVFSTKGRKPGALRRRVRFLRQIVKGELSAYWLAAAFDRHLKIIEIHDVNAPQFVMKVLESSIGFVAGFNQIFRRELIENFSTLINFHPSLLPYYRGAIPSYWVIKNGEMVSGFSAHVLVEKVDAGEVVYQEEVTVEEGMSETELDKKISRSASRYFEECLKALAQGEPFRKGLSGAQYSHKVGYVPSKREEAE